ncbi:MAG: hypothetical protein EHM18_02960 [Acidobacteria bacterium]|nr:MAG: hypothetical protein EHM18_02960 [Acidobacteriota bacterium]
MNVILFETSSCDLYPILQHVVREDREIPAPRGFWGGLKEQIRTGYQKIKERIHHEEAFCASLRHTTHLRVFYPTSNTSEEAEKRFRQFLRLGYSKHSRWFWVDAVLAFFGIFLMFLPGPNIFFFYPAIRSFGHYQARSGARHALGLSDITFNPEPLVDEIQDHLHDLESVDAAIQQLETRYQVDNLRLLLLKLGEK